jgi:hypothetical protein
MDFLTPRIAPGIGVAMARVATRFYFFSFLLVASTIYLPHKGPSGPYGLLVLAVLTIGVMIFISLFPWDDRQPRAFTLTYLLSSCGLISLLVYFTGGAQSAYGILFFLIIFFSFFYNQAEMYLITTIVSLFYLVPFLYDSPNSYHFTTAAITVLFFYFGTYILHGVTRIVVKKNQTLEELNRNIMELDAITSRLVKDLETGSLPDSLAETLKEHLPSTYCLMMLLDEEQNLISQLACPVRPLTWTPMIGSIYAPHKLISARTVLETRQPRLFQLATDALDEDLRALIPQNTQSVLIVPIRVGAENIGVMAFGEERQWARSAFTNEKIKLAIAITKQIATGLNMWWCFERLREARRDLEVSHDKIIKAERLAALGEVTRAVEHEINNPLSVIVNWSEIFRHDESIDPPLRNKFQIIYDMSIRIMAVIRKLSEVKDAQPVEFIKGQNMTRIE